MTTLKEAGLSVERRGFLDGNQRQPFTDPLLMAQVGRLIEEAGEFARSMRSMSGPSASELADIVIVCAAIAHHMDWDLDAEVVAKCQSDESKRGYLHNGTGNGNGIAMVDEAGG